MNKFNNEILHKYIGDLRSKQNKAKNFSTSLETNSKKFPMFFPNIRPNILLLLINTDNVFELYTHYRVH